MKYSRFIFLSLLLVVLCSSTAFAGNFFNTVLGVQSRAQTLAPVKANEIVVKDAKKLHALGLTAVSDGDSVEVVNLGNGDWYVRDPESGQSVLTKTPVDE